MTDKIRIQELAEEYGLSGEDCAATLRGFGFSKARSQLSGLDEFEAMQARGLLEANGYAPVPGDPGGDVEVPREILKRSAEGEPAFGAGLREGNMTSSSSSSEALALTLTHAAGDALNDIHREEQGSLQPENEFADWFDGRSERGALAEQMLDTSTCRVEFESSSGRHGDPIYFVYVPRRAKRDHIRLQVVAKSDCALVVRAKKWWRMPPAQAVTWPAGVSFPTRGQPVPAAVVRACSQTRDAETRRSQVTKNIRAWTSFLTIQRDAAEERRFQLSYRSRRSGHRSGQLILVVDAPPQLLQRLENYRDRLSILQDKLTDDRESSFDRVVAEVRPVRLQVGTGGKELLVEIDEDDPRILAQIANRIPDHGWLANREAGTFVQIKRQEVAIEDLRHGHALIENLDQILYADDLERLEPLSEAAPIPESECLLKEVINEDQRLAIAMALASPDTFFLQGPPGTGKTTVIAELCYQLARRGKKVLVSSQTNLAVDNALARLEMAPEILATRLGNPRSMEEEGLGFVGDAAISRWLSAVSLRVVSKVASLREIQPVLELVTENDSALRGWFDCGSPAPNTSTRDIASAKAAFEDLTGLLVAVEPARRTDEERSHLVAALATANDEVAMLRPLRDAADQALQHGLTTLASVDLAQLPPNVRDLPALLEELGACLANSPKARGEFRNVEQTLGWFEKAVAEANPTGAKIHLPVIQAALADARWKAARPLIGMLWRAGLERLLRGIRECYATLSSQLSAPDRFPGALRIQLEDHRSSLSDRIQAAEDEARILTDKLEGLEHGDAMAALAAAHTRLEQKLAAEGQASIDASFASCFQQVQHLHANRRATLASAIWSQLVEHGVLDAHAHRSYSALRSALSAEHEETGIPFGRSRAALTLLDEWSTVLSQGEKDLDPALRTAFDEQVNVVGATCSFTASLEFKRRFAAFDCVIVDEVSKATATELLMPAVHGRLLVLVGDHKQLAPILGSEREGSSFEDAARELGLNTEQFGSILGRSLFKERFEHLEGIPGARRTLMLRKQYRMHTAIMHGINQFYDGALQAGLPDLDEQRKLLGQRPTWLAEDAHVVWIDLPSGAEWRSRQEPGSTSSINEREATVTAVVAGQLASSFGTVHDIGVISLYAGQARLIEREVGKRIDPTVRHATGMRISTVDRFQGSECDIVLLSLCANGRKPSAFLNNPNRINVAMSRARRLLVIVGSSRTFCDQFGAKSHYGTFLELARRAGAHTDARHVLEAL